MLSKTVDPFVTMYGDLLAAHIRFARSLTHLWSTRPPATSTSTSMSTPTPMSAPAPAAPAVPEDRLRARAYELYLQRGGQPGHDAEDWDRARAELGVLTPSG